MNRRDFLSKFLLSATGLYVVPKTLIFDIGAHVAEYYDATTVSYLNFTHIRVAEMWNRVLTDEEMELLRKTPRSQWERELNLPYLFNA